MLLNKDNLDVSLADENEDSLLEDAFEEPEEIEEHPDDTKPATRDLVIQYLVREYGATEERAIFDVDDQILLLDRGISLGSFTYYVGDQIAVASNKKQAELNHPEKEDI